MKIILFVALPSEFPRELCPDHITLIYTGVGKVNAAFAATRCLLGEDPQATHVLNYGSAGSASLPIHSFLRCTRFRQADMDARPLAPVPGHTPFDEVIHPHVEPETIVFDEEGHLCTTQDTFQQKPAFDINDMEAYAIAKTCRILGFGFTAYKFISDSGDAHDWEDNHHLGMEAFSATLARDWMFR